MDLLFSVMLLLMNMFSGGSAGDGNENVSTTSELMSALLLPPSARPSAEGAGSTAPGSGGAVGDTGDAGSATPVKKDPQPDAPKVKGIYVTAHSAGGSRMEKLLALLDDTDLNSMVIDLKDDNGYITYPTDNPELLKMGTSQKYIRDIGALMDRLKEHDVYPIGRIVVFKDSVLAGKHPELSFLRKDGSIWANSSGASFVNPYMKEVWDYNIAVAKEAAKLGFKEIQFDYVRFPEGFENKADSLTFEKNELSRVETVAAFVNYAKQQLEPLGVRVSVDIFGYAASVPAAEGIGQDFVKISKHVDVISPMIYPSHYSTGWFGVKDPDTDPYATIKGAMTDTHKKLDPIGSWKPVIRPWIQDFTASWLGKGHYIPYGAAQVQAQIKALHDTGIDEFLLWNAGNTYSTGVSYK